MKNRYLEIAVSLLFIGLFIGVLSIALEKRRAVMGPDTMQRLLEVDEGETVATPREAGAVDDMADLRSESDSLETRARDLRQEGRKEEALTQLREAIDLQERINREDAGSAHADRRRITSLRREIANWEAEPLHEMVVNLEQQGRLALDENDFEQAQEIYTEALALAREINEQHTRSRYYDPTMARNLERSLQQSRLQPLLSDQESLVAEAREYAQEEEFSTVREKMERALALQDQVEEEFPEHPSADEQNRENLLREKDTLLGRVMAERFDERFDAMQESFAERDIDHGRRIAQEVFGLYDVLRLDFPRADYPGDQRSQQVDFLREVGNARGDLVEEIWEALLAVPEHPVKLFTREVSQSLYERVTGQNPSRNVGERLPVDSVTYEDAQSFADSLSLLLGHTVRLPTEEEMVAALGEVPSLESLADAVWYADNSGGRSQPTGEREPLGEGFYDLLGNVAQWVDSGLANEALAFGGHYNEPLGALQEVPRQSHSTNFRSRAIGLRFVVKTD